MKKLTLILGIVLLVGCSKESYYEFITQRIDTIYHKNIILKIIPKTPIYTIHYDISKKEANDFCKANSSYDIKKYVILLMVDGIVYPYYNVEIVITCKIKE